MIRAFAVTSLLALAAPAFAEEHQLLPPPGGSQSMSPGRLLEIVTRLDPDATVNPGGIELTLDDVPILIIMDPRANRMRAMVPVASADGLSEADLLRMMQANFDTALDARYAIAGGRLWSVFIHPLGELEDRQLVSGLAQAVTLAQTYGQTYSSGGSMFNNGDSGGLLQELLEGEDI